MGKKKKYYSLILLGMFLLLGLWATSLYSYLLFHSLAELFSIVVACGIFMLAWNSRKVAKNDYLLFLGIAYLFIGTLDLIHTLAYKGMGIFQGYNTNLSAQLWIAARYLESLSLLLAPLLIGRKLKASAVFLGYSIATVVLLGSMFYWPVFPVCFVEGVGLTAFKKVSEYIISSLLLASGVLLFRKRHTFERSVLHLLIASIGVTIASELAFTLYSDPYGLANLIGHYLKIVSFYLIYKAIVETGLARPFALLLRDIKQSEDDLRGAKENLELQVNMRTAELTQANAALRAEITERKQAEDKVRKSEEKYRTLIADIPDVTWTSDNKGNTTFVSSNIKKTYGYSPAEIYREGEQLWFGRIHPDDAENVRRAFGLLFDIGSPYDIEYRIKKRDGEWIWLHDRSINTYEKDGVTYADGVCSDITEHKRLEESLRRREAILQAVAYAAEHFLKAPSWEDDVDLVLARLGQASEASRVYVFKNHTDATGELLASQRYEWVAPGVTAQLDNPDMRGISWRSGAMRRAAEILSSGGCVSGHVRDFLPAEQEMMSTQDIQSMVVVPIFADGEWWGFMGFDECVREREWFAAEIDALKAGASTLGAAIHRKRVEDALKESATRLQLATGGVCV